MEYTHTFSERSNRGVIYGFVCAMSALIPSIKKQNAEEQKDGGAHLSMVCGNLYEVMLAAKIFNCHNLVQEILTEMEGIQSFQKYVEHDNSENV